MSVILFDVSELSGKKNRLKSVILALFEFTRIESHSLCRSRWLTNNRVYEAEIAVVVRESIDNCWIDVL